MTRYNKTMSDALREVYKISMDEQLARVKGNTPADKGRRAAIEDDIERAKKKGDKDLVKKLEEGKMKDKLLKTADLIQKMIKPGDPDRHDYAAVRDHIEANNMKTLKSIVTKMDTVPKERIAVAMAKGLGAKETEKILGVKLNMGEEVELDESVIDKVKEIASKKSAKKIDGVMVDSFTASAISQIYDKVNDANKKKMEKLPITKLADLAFKMMQKSEFVPEEVELDEVFDFVLLDKDNKIAGRYSGSNAKKEAESGKKSAHLPPMSIPKGDVKKMKIVPIAPKDKKGIGDTVLAIGEEVELDEGYLELEFKDKRTAEQAYNYINNKIWAGGNPPYEDFNQEGNTIQIDTDANLNRRNQMLKDLKALPSNMKFKVAVNEKIKEAHEFGTDEYREYLEKLTPGEETELDEGRMKELHGYINDGKKPEWIAKKMKLDVKTIKALMGESAASDARRAIARDKDLGRKRDSADVDNDASVADVKAANKNIIQQLKKILDTRKPGTVEFLDKKKQKVDYKLAQKAVQKYMSFRRPSEKGDFQAQLAKSYKNFLTVLKASYKPESTILDRIGDKLKERKDG